MKIFQEGNLNHLEIKVHSNLCVKMKDDLAFIMVTQIKKSHGTSAAVYY